MLIPSNLLTNLGVTRLLGKLDSANAVISVKRNCRKQKEIMNIRSLKIGVASQNARRCFIVSLITLLPPTLCVAPLLSEFQFYYSASLRSATCPFIQIILGEQGWCLACCSHFPTKNNQTVHLKEQL